MMSATRACQTTGRTPQATPIPDRAALQSPARPFDALASDTESHRDHARQRERLRDIRLSAMKRGIEAGDLRNVRSRLQNGADRGQVMRLMQWRQLVKPRQFFQHIEVK